MSNKVTIAISAALLFAAAASVGSAAGSRASTTDELPLLPQASHCGAGPHCQHFNIGDRTLGPTFPTACRQIT
jgi:hypothetical protein